MSIILQFPSKENIISYLEKHPETNKKTNPYLTEKKIIEAVATYFANQEKYPLAVDLEVTNLLYDMKHLKLDKVTYYTIQKKLALVLKECASKEEVSEEKKMETKGISKL